MKKGQVNAILVDQVRIKHKIAGYIFAIIVVTSIFVSFVFLFTAEQKAYYVSYKEQSNLDYKVYLKPNDFFPNSYLDKNNQYIASLIDYISANFDYDLRVDNQNINYQYSYRIEAVVNVAEKDSDRSLYNYTEVLEEQKLTTPLDNTNVKIHKDLKIDYNNYNELIKNFVNTYDLENIVSTLNINMYVSVFGNCDEIENSDNESVISLTIPLTTRTVGIDISYNLLEDNSEKIMLCKDVEKSNLIIPLGMFLSGVMDVCLVIILIRYILNTRTAESIYERELKRILNNYKSFIQKVNNNFDLRGYKVLKVDTFNDMLEIRDTTCEPILMVENKEKDGVYFFIPSKTKILYSYGLRLKDIKNKGRK